MHDRGDKPSLAQGVGSSSKPSGHETRVLSSDGQIPILHPKAETDPQDFTKIERVVPFDRRKGVDRRRTMVVSEQIELAVLLPCRNEAATIGEVVADFKAALPTAAIYVYDNASSDDTAEIARNAGAIVRSETKPGKGGVIRRMFSEIDADVYVMVDGDGTYDAAAAPRLVSNLLSGGLDMVVGRRREMPGSPQTYRRGHRLGNVMLTGVVQYIFGQGCMDMLSGYRVFSRKYVKSFPVASRGFEIETEMTVHALDVGLPVGEMDTVYEERPENSHSKLRTIPDGIRILAFIAMLVKEYRPAVFFGSLGALSALASVLSHTVARRWLSGMTSSGIVTGVAIGLAVAAVGLLLAGLILDSLSRSRREVKRMMYLGAGSSNVSRRTPSETVEIAPQTTRRTTDRA